MTEEIFFYHITFCNPKNSKTDLYHVYKRSACLSSRGTLLVKEELLLNLKRGDGLIILKVFATDCVSRIFESMYLNI